MTALWLVNAQTEQVSGTPDFGHNDTMGYYNQDDLPFYYGLAQTFAISDRHFCSVVGPTFPNRSYELAATSFGHVTTNEIFPPGINPANPVAIKHQHRVSADHRDRSSICSTRPG